MKNFERKFSVKELKKNSKKIDALVKKIKPKNPNQSPITDGIINIEEYHDSPIRILWILKESYDQKGKEKKEGED